MCINVQVVRTTCIDAWLKIIHVISSATSKDIIIIAEIPQQYLITCTTCACTQEQLTEAGSILPCLLVG